MMRAEPIGKRHYVSARGELWLEPLSTRLMATRIVGHFDDGLAEHFQKEMDAWLALDTAPVTAFHDWQGCSDYDISVRHRLTPWTARVRPRFEAVHLLLGSKVMVWGVQLVNSVTGNFLTAHHDRSAFEQIFREAKSRLA